jgi:UDP-N-acetylglucosamine transferase subunit ALG13
MVFVTVGSTSNNFGRLFREIDRLVADGTLTDVVAQIGETEYCPKHFTWFPFLPFDEVCRYMEDADTIICHAGTGSLNMALGFAKKTITVPRRREFGEHPDNHQIELAEHLGAQGRVLYAKNPSDLRRLVQKLDSWEPILKDSSEASQIVASVERIVSGWTGYSSRM